MFCRQLIIVKGPLLAVAFCWLLFCTQRAQAQTEQELLQPINFQDLVTPATAQPPTAQPPTTPPPTGNQPPSTVQPPTRTNPSDRSIPPRPRLDLRRPTLGRSSRVNTLGEYRSGYLADRLARAPNMFGDFFMSGGQAFIFGQTGPTNIRDVMFDMPTAGGSRRIKISDNNHALPTDRVFFMYNHFHNALNTTVGPAPPGNKSVDRYTIGLEKTFWDGDASAEVRMPFTGTYHVGGPALPTVEGGNVGNLALILKFALLRWDDAVLSAGMGIDMPTGSDLTVDLRPRGLLLENESTHLLPYVGASMTPTERSFCHIFAQLDLATSGNSLTFFDPVGAPTPLGVLNEQNLLYFDVGGGFWLYQNPDARFCTGLAVVSELHLTSTIQDADKLNVPGVGVFGNQNNRQDSSNATIGVHLQMGPRSTFHVGGVLPLRTGADQGFDSEIQAAFNCRY